MNFWEWLIHNQLIAGDADYYASGKASQDEIKHALNTAIANLEGASAPNAKQDFYTRLQTATGFGGDAGYYARGEAGADEFANLVNVVSTSFKKEPAGAGAGHPAEPGAPAKPKVGTPSGVLAGGRTVKIQQPDKTYRWYQLYELPPGSGKYAAYQFDNVQQVEAAFGEVPTHARWKQEWLDATTMGAIGAAEEVIGMAGNWRTFADQIAREAAQRAGVRDPSLIGRMMADPEMQTIMTRAAVGSWTDEQIRAEQRRTKFWTETLYPGIKNFYGSTQEPERAWANYVDNVTPALTNLGYKKDADGSYNSQIKKMLDSKIEAQTFLENVPVFQQAVQNQDFFNVLNQRAQKELGKSVTFGDWFNLLKGEAAPEIATVAEGATVAYQAQQAGVGLQEDMLQRLIAERDLSEAEARNVFSEVNQAVLALGESGLARGNLSRDDVLSAAAGIAPSSGLSTDEVRLKVAKLAQENDLFDEEKVSFYLGFSPSGTPTRPGLAALRPEGA